MIGSMKGIMVPDVSSIKVTEIEELTLEHLKEKIKFIPEVMVHLPPKFHVRGKTKDTFNWPERQYLYNGNLSSYML